MKNFSDIPPIAKGVMIGRKALEKYGPERQTLKAQEELFELILELRRWKDDKSYSQDRLVDEIADVWVVALQMAVLHGWDKVLQRFDYKLDRLEKVMRGPPRPTFYPSAIEDYSREE